MVEQKLFAVAEPLLAEAPSSWLPRAAASQSEPTREFAKFLGFSDRSDYDVQFVSMAPRHIAKMCGFHPEIFDVVHQMLGLAVSLRLAHPVLLQQRKLPRYRFCPRCLEAQRIPHLPIHWRIDAYRLCHIHRCILEDACPHCQRPIRPQRDWMSCGQKQKGISMSSQCLHYSKLLWKLTPLSIDDIDPCDLSSLDKVRMENGRAFVAALAQERVVIPASNVTEVWMGLKLVEKSRLLAAGTDLNISYFRRMQVVGLIKSRTVQSPKYPHMKSPRQQQERRIMEELIKRETIGCSISSRPVGAAGPRSEIRQGEFRREAPFGQTAQRHGAEL